MPRYRADLHVHSCLSPCADIDVSPRTLARRGASLGLNMLALTDHNSSANGPAHRDCCRTEGLVPVFGMELTTLEEVHCLCLFGELDEALDFQALVYSGLPRFPVDEKFYYPQLIVNSHEEILDQVDFLLTPASALDISTALAQVHARGGIFVPAHIDKARDSLFSQLGFLPDDPFDAVEITLPPDESARQIARGSLPFVANSDCHILEDLAQRYTEFEAEHCSFDGLRKALEIERELEKEELPHPPLTWVTGVWGFPKQKS